MAKISVVLPCRDEEKTIGVCIDKLKKALKGQDYEIIVSDSSTDRSADIARKKGVKVIMHGLSGYGNAYLEGFKQVSGDIVVMGDSDNTYDFLELPLLLKQAEKYDLVMGRRRFIDKNAMPFLHKDIGNPLLSFILRLFFGAKVKDTHSGFRVIKTAALKKLDLKTTGMEFASEMIIKAVKSDLSIKEVPIHYHKRIGDSKLESFRDGWKHLRFMLLYSPAYLFFFPGMLLFLAGFFGLFLSGLKIHGLIVSSFVLILGFQLIFLTLFARIYLYAVLKESQPLIDLLIRHLTLERGIAIGSFIFLVGLVFGAKILFWFLEENALPSPESTIISLTVLVVGLQLIFNAFYLSILGIEKK